jgi:hypothetical protein
MDHYTTTSITKPTTRHRNLFLEKSWQTAGCEDVQALEFRAVTRSNDPQCVSAMYGTLYTTSSPGMKSSPDYVALYGLNSFEIFYSATNYIKALYDLGVIGPGKEIDTAPLPMDSLGKAQFYEA